MRIISSSHIGGYSRVTKKEIHRIVSAVLKRHSVDSADISVLFVGDVLMKKLNTQFLKHRYTTDILTFNYGTRSKVQSEVIINLQEAKRNAKKFNVSRRNEVIRLIVHGTLHAIGYTDTTPRSRKKMHQMQEQIVSVVS